MKQYLVNAIILLSIVGIIFFLIVNKRYKDTDSDEQLIEPKINHNTTPDIAEDEMDTEDAIVSEDDGSSNKDCNGDCVPTSPVSSQPYVTNLVPDIPLPPKTIGLIE